MRRILATLVLAALAVGCGSNEPSRQGSPRPTGTPLPPRSRPVKLDPADFVATIDHPFWPMRPGVGLGGIGLEGQVEGANEVTYDIKDPVAQALILRAVLEDSPLLRPLDKARPLEYILVTGESCLRHPSMARVAQRLNRRMGPELPVFGVTVDQDRSPTVSDTPASRSPATPDSHVELRQDLEATATVAALIEG
jgi:hypothetical protein